MSAQPWPRGSPFGRVDRTMLRANTRADRRPAMPLEFSGPATPLDDAAIADAAKKLGCEVAAVRAVIDVESRGGFLSDGRPKILFERHYFSRLTKRKFDASHPGVSNGQWGGYGAGGAHQYDRLNQAAALDRDAALHSASWGLFQIM